MTPTTDPASPKRAASAARFRLRAAAWGIALLLPLPDALALSLGRLQGTAVLGRPVQVAVPVALPADEELNCVRAEMQQQDLPASPLAWRLERTGGSAVLRLSSSQPVQEPVVTVRVTVGCHDQFSQGYVLLADPPQVRDVVPPLAAAAPVVAAAPVAEVGPVAPPRPAARRAPAPRPAAEAAAVAAPQRPARPPLAKAPATAREPIRPRLEMDLLDIAIDQAPLLKASTQLAPPAPQAMTRAEAAAAWQEINASPEQQLAAAREQSRAVQSEIKALREQTRRQSEQLQTLVDQRNLARDIIAGIAGAIAVGLALLLWRRSRETAAQRAWYQRSRPAAAAAVGAPGDSSFVDSSFPEHVQEPPRVAPEPDSGWAAPPHAGTGGVRAAESGYGRSRMLPTAEELLDVQEKANFFLAIGQPEKAIELLESRLLEHLGASPFLWLDLLDLCRKLQRAEDYERVREEFQRTFAARLPHFEDAQTQNGGLESYPKALSRIELLWPSTRVMQEIEKSLFEERAPGAIMFDLEASRELLLLYSIAMDVTSREDGRPYTPTMVTALESEATPSAEDSHFNTQPMALTELDAQESAMPSAMITLGLDLDFNALEKTAVLPQLDLDALAVAPAPTPAAAPSPELDVALDVDLDLDLDRPRFTRVK